MLDRQTDKSFEGCVRTTSKYLLQENGRKHRSQLKGRELQEATVPLDPPRINNMVARFKHIPQFCQKLKIMQVGSQKFLLDKSKKNPPLKHKGSSRNHHRSTHGRKEDYISWRNRKAALSKSYSIWVHMAPPGPPVKWVGSSAAGDTHEIELWEARETRSP